jgi:hypothetical protein
VSGSACLGKSQNFPDCMRIVYLSARHAAEMSVLRSLGTNKLLARWMGRLAALRSSVPMPAACVESVVASLIGILSRRRLVKSVGSPDM